MRKDKKEARKVYNREYSQSAKAKAARSIYMKEYRKTDIYKAARKLIDQADRRKAYEQSDKRRASRVELTRKYRVLHPEKVFAHSRALSLPVEPCSVEDCGAVGERHHEDYSRPLEVVYLCRSHHSQWHTARRNLTIMLEKERMEAA